MNALVLRVVNRFLQSDVALAEIEQSTLAGRAVTTP
jgi:hypothetical protein